MKSPSLENISACVGVYKPHPAVYGMAPQAFGMSKETICFLSSNNWDAYAAKAFGFRVLWCNRFGQAPENIPSMPDGGIADLSALSKAIAMDSDK